MSPWLVNQASRSSFCEKTQHSTHLTVKLIHLKILKKNFSHFFNVLMSLIRLLSNQNRSFCQINGQFMLESVIPDFPHFFPIFDFSSFYRFRNIQNISLLLDLFSDEVILLVHPERLILLLGVPYQSRKAHRWRKLIRKPCFNTATSIVYYYWHFSKYLKNNKKLKFT